MALTGELAAAANSPVAVAVEVCCAEVVGLEMTAGVNTALVAAVPDGVAPAIAATEHATDRVSVEADDVEVVLVLGYHNSTMKLDLLPEVIFAFEIMGMWMESVL